RARARAETAGLRKSAREDEKHVVKLEKRKSELESRLSDPEIYEGPTATLMELQVKLGKIKTALGEAEDAWMEMEAKIEATDT
ncbi:MAG: ABC transporter ATP-binding protein, partial [Rhodospirillales bacterium]|nr:ABC transporter ATP-binding protein [Rhodospirillales bacterium]